MGAPVRSSTEITQIINRAQHAIADLGTQLVDQAKRGLDISNTSYRDEMYRLKFLRAILHNILDDDANVRTYYQASVNEDKFNHILDGLVKLSGSFDGPGINIIGVRRNLLFFTGNGSTGGGGGGPANPGGTTFQNLDVSAPSENIDTFDANTSTFALYIYSVLGANPGEGSRTGTIIASWNGSNDPTYAETRTADVGGITTPITFKVELNAGQIELNAFVSTDGWVVKGVRMLFVNFSFINPTGGLPTGGTTGQFLRKASNADGDATWQSLVWTMITDVTVSLAEINRVSGVTSPIQTQLDAITTLITAVIASLANYLLLSGGTMSGNIALGGHKITGSGAATGNGDLLRYEQLVGVYQLLNQALLLTGGTMSGNIAMGGNSVTGLRAAVAAGEAVRYEQMPLTVSINIGVWNMQTSAGGTSDISFAHGQSDFTKIRIKSVMIINDAGTQLAPLFNWGAFSVYVDSTNIHLSQVREGIDFFNFPQWSGGGNRGYVSIEIAP